MSGYDAYSYNDIEGYYRKKLDLQIPAWVISKTLALLRERTKTTHGGPENFKKSSPKKTREIKQINFTKKFF